MCRPYCKCPVVVKPPVAETTANPFRKPVVPEVAFFWCGLVCDRKWVVVEIGPQFLLLDVIKPLGDPVCRRVQSRKEILRQCIRHRRGARQHNFHNVKCDLVQNALPSVYVRSVSHSVSHSVRHLRLSTYVILFVVEMRTAVRLRASSVLQSAEFYRRSVARTGASTCTNVPPCDFIPEFSR